MKPVSTTTHVLCTGLCAAFCLFAATQISFANSAEGLPPLGPPALGDPTPSPTPKGQPPPPIQPPAAPNTANDYTGTTGGSLISNGNWSLGHVPTVSEDARYTGVTNGNRTITDGSLTVGSFNLTGNAGTFTISNNTGSTTNSTLTLGGPGDGGNSVAPSSSDLLYVATGATLNINGPNGGSGAGTLSVVLGQSGSFDAAGTIGISAVISDGGSNFGVTKTGSGTLTMSGANTYGGATMVNAGTLSVNNNNTTTARLAGTSNITINSGGTLLLSQTGVTSNDRINNSATMTLNGGTFNTGGLSEHGTNNNSAGIGALTLSANSIINMGAGNSIVAFANSSAATWTGTLSIYNWTGTPNQGGGTDQLYFGSDNSGLTNSQLSNITFYSDSGTTALGVAEILANGEIVPVPEPATWFAGSLAIVGIGGIWLQRIRRRRAIA